MPCKKAGLKGVTSNELTAGCGLSSIECALDLNAPSNRPPSSTNMKLVERTRSNRGNTVYAFLFGECAEVTWILWFLFVCMHYIEDN